MVGLCFFLMSLVLLNAFIFYIILRIYIFIYILFIVLFSMEDDIKVSIRGYGVICYCFKLFTQIRVLLSKAIFDSSRSINKLSLTGVLRKTAEVGVK